MTDVTNSGGDEKPAEEKAAKGEKLVTVRVLTDTGDFKCGDVVQIDKQTLQSNPNDFDANPAAVAYAKGVIERRKAREKALAEAAAEQ